MHNGTESLLTADPPTIISTCLYGNKGRIFEVSLNEILLDLQCILGERVQFFLQHPALVGGTHRKDRADFNYEWPFLSLWWQVRHGGAHQGHGGDGERGPQLSL